MFFLHLVKDTFHHIAFLALHTMIPLKGLHLADLQCSKSSISIHSVFSMLSYWTQCLQEHLRAIYKWPTSRQSQEGRVRIDKMKSPLKMFVAFFFTEIWILNSYNCRSVHITPAEYNPLLCCLSVWQYILNWVKMAPSIYLYCRYPQTIGKCTVRVQQRKTAKNAMQKTVHN